LDAKGGRNWKRFDNLAAQKSTLEGLAARCDQRFNAFVGDAFHVGLALDDAEAKILLKQELWQFEKLVDYVAGIAI
jgi:hypothetical protein